MRVCLHVQNGTTNSVHEIVDQLNKADLPDPSKVGRPPLSGLHETDVWEWTLSHDSWC